VPVLYLRAEDGVLFPLPTQPPAAGEPPVVKVSQEMESVSGQVTGARVKGMDKGRLEIETKVKTVEKDGSVVGLEIEGLGG
jgi:hypothetical protein